MSFGPPGAMGTIQRTGLVGYDCAHAKRAPVGSAAAPAVRYKNLRRGSFMASPVCDWYPWLRVPLAAVASAALIRFYGGGFPSKPKDCRGSTATAKAATAEISTDAH